MEMRANMFRIAAVAVLALPLAAGVAPVPAFETGAALAQPGNGNGHGNAGGNGNGNGNGGGNGNGNGNRGGEDHASGNGNGNGPRGQGAIASELRNANAANANINAMLNAAPDSNVGRLNTLREAIGESEEAYTEWQAAYSDYIAFRDSYDGRTAAEIEEEIAGLDDTSATYEEELARLTAELEAAEGYDAELDRLAGLSNDAAEAYEEVQGLEEDALLAVTGGRELSDAAMAELRRRLTQ
ncbi:hypothetical protein [Roseicyclus sp.]|uniref:hypothetical protein n=1 Tax=Roseicyclus sp. TaxID=1914329 RepID=UPI003F9F7596